MIQRIQSVYLLLAAVLLVGAFFTPISSLSDAAGTEAFVSLCSISAADAALQRELDGASIPALTIAAAIAATLAAALCVFAIFGYKNRKRQLQTVLLADVCIVLTYAALLGNIFTLTGKLPLAPGGCIGALLPLAAYAMTWLARRGIQKDEALVRSAERFW